ncbi:MAG: hypothetical protein HY700_01235 [Gemmatimonadetes bacterium]|nr:hypothetical protein [Gemmatimonadota bacterium]
MFKVVFLTQWKWSRTAVLAGVFAAFALPILSVQQAGVFAGPTRELPGHARRLLDTVQTWGIAYPLLALVLGVLVAVTAWAADHRGRHVYALALPVPRWHYVLLRFAAGGALLLAPLAALGVGALLASASVTLPPGLQAYPVALTVRFGLALLVAYAVIFSISAGTPRTAAIVLSAIAFLVAVEVLAAAVHAPIDPLQFLGSRVLSGPFGIFTGRWMLIDV